MDTYYDTPDFNLTKNDIWLRKRANEFEVKIPSHQVGKEVAIQYQEIAGEQTIREIFALPLGDDFLADIAKFGYQSFCEMETCADGESDFFQERKKVLEYLKKEKPEHYAAMLAAGVIAEK